MDESPDSTENTFRKPRLIAYGFIGAFALSVFTVIYTGLNVEDYLGEFDAGFRPVTMAVGEVRSVDLAFDSENAYPDAFLEITLPEMLAFADSSVGPAGRIPAVVVAGPNRFSVEIEALEEGRGYLIARVAADEPIGLYRLFVTATEE